jgi:hypothetical protein
MGGEGLLESSSFKANDTINQSHIITAGELVLNAPIGVGAEGKVGCGVGLAVCHTMWSVRSQRFS